MAPACSDTGCTARDTVESAGTAVLTPPAKLARSLCLSSSDCRRQQACKRSFSNRYTKHQRLQRRSSMHCSGRCAGFGASPRVLKSHRPALHQPITVARPPRGKFSSQSSTSNLPQKQTKRSKVASQAGSSSHASVIQRAPSGTAQQAALQQQDLAVPRSVVIAIDYTSDAEQALQWALDFVVKPGIYGAL